MTSKVNSNNINLQLGDIIKIDAPSNINLHNKIYIIDYINEKKINLKNEETSLTLEFKDNVFLEESIKKIDLLFRNDSPSYIEQNNIKIDKIISIYFGGKLPFVLNGRIVNIEDDMIEIQSIPDKKIYYIDFAYSGIPENLNIEKIILRSSEEDISEFKKDDSNKIDDDLVKDEVELQNLKDYDDDLFVKDYNDFNELILDSIEFGEKTEEIFYNVEVPDNEKRYTIESQIHDYMETMLLKKSKLEDHNITINRLKKEINRYKELRNLYSIFDKNNNPLIPIEKTEFYKPLKELLYNLNKLIYTI